VPSELAGAWGTDEAKFNGNHLVAGTVLYLRADGRYRVVVVAPAPVVGAGCKGGYADFDDERQWLVFGDSDSSDHHCRGYARLEYDRASDTLHDGRSGSDIIFHRLAARGPM
jgi:hypothetical protein